MIDKRLLKEMPQAKKYVFAQVGMQWIAMLCNVVFIVLTAWILEKLFINDVANIDILLFISGIIISLCIRILCVRKASDYSHSASCNVKDTLRLRLYQKLLDLKGDYQSYVSTSELVQLNVEGVDQLETYFGRYLPQFFYSMLAPVTLFLIVMFLDFKSALVLLICVPLIPISIIVVQKIAKRLLSKYWTKYTTLGNSFLENLQGLTTLKIYQSDAYKNEQMNQEAEEFRKVTMKVLTMQLNSISVMDLIAYGGAAIGSIVAIHGYLNGSVSLFGVLVIILISSEFFIPMRLLGSFFHIAMNGIAASAKIFRILDLEVSDIQGVSLEEGDISMNLKHVNFSYDGDRQVINDVSITLPQNQFVAIVGESGSGKSTLAKVLMGIQKNYQGDVMVQGVQRRDIDDASFYDRFVYVSHREVLFKGSIKDNLLMGNPQAADEMMWEVLKQVQLDAFLKEQDGLSTQLLENGANFSGGQRQRLALARALLKNGDVYVFDEATSNVDMESEDAILAVIQQLAKTKTVIMITHRLSSIINSDVIYVMKDGAMIESGTHRTLIRQAGTYADMYHKQHQLEAYNGGN